MFSTGTAIAISTSATIASPFVSHDRFVPFITVVLLGLFLGMRHSTDPDHVVAVSTIVSRQRSIVHSTVIGMMWGSGYSLTIFVVGAVIIIFGVVIPPRLGLSMEFSVALMLILLGILNLTGVMRWITERFTPSHKAHHSVVSSPADKMEPASSPDQRSFWSRTMGNLGIYQTARPFAIGLVHGLAGSAAVALSFFPPSRVRYGQRPICWCSAQERWWE